LVHTEGGRMEESVGSGDCCATDMFEYVVELETRYSCYVQITV
jgi:hypothetical protein